MRPLTIALAGLALTPVFAQDPGPDNKVVDKAALRAKAIAFERDLDLRTYKKDYNARREWLATRFPGRWVVIAGGKLMPIRVDPTRQFNKLYFEPAETLEAAVAAADKAVPDALHRFVFRVGEDGDHAFEMGMTTKSHVLGGGFYELLPGETILTSKQLFTGGKGGGLVIDLEAPHTMRAQLWEPVPAKDSKPAVTSFLLASVYTGAGTVSKATGERLHLERWEIPGKVEIAGMSQSGTLRRARVLLTVEGKKLRVGVPVAVWDR